LTGPAFEPYFMNVKSGEKSRVDVYIQMPFTHLRFEKAFDGFRASYTCTFIIRDKERQIVQTKETDRLLEQRTYDETVSQRFDFFLQSFLLEPGRYSIEIISLDNLTRTRYRHRQFFEAKNFSLSKINASTELLLDTVMADGRAVTLRPVLPSSISFLSSNMGVFQELYNIKARDTITVSQAYSVPKRVFNSNNKDRYTFLPYGITMPVCIDDYDSTYYKSDSSFVANKDSTIQLIQFYSLPVLGNTTVTRSVVRKNNEYSDTLITKRLLFRRDSKLSNRPTADEMMASMRYILRPYEFDSIIAASNEEQMKKIDEFWELHGSYQGKSDFERRVMEANSLFTTCIEGSKTPMGIVYVICGPPTYVDCRNTFNENWYYTIGEKTFGIQFRLENSNSEFKYYEIVPFSINESVWQYFVDQWRKK